MFTKEGRILVIDDMKTMRKIVSKSLADLGFTDVVEAEDGEKGFAAIDSSAVPIQLIISDWNMPVMTGLDLLKKVRATAKVGKTPFILLTAESESAQVQTALQAGVDNYIIKPFTTTGLDAKIKEVAARRSKAA